MKRTTNVWMRGIALILLTFLCGACAARDRQRESKSQSATSYSQRSIGRGPKGATRPLSYQEIIRSDRTEGQVMSLQDLISESEGTYELFDLQTVIQINEGSPSYFQLGLTFLPEYREQNGRIKMSLIPFPDLVEQKVEKDFGDALFGVQVPDRIRRHQNREFEYAGIVRLRTPFFFTSHSKQGQPDLVTIYGRDASGQIDPDAGDILNITRLNSNMDIRNVQVYRKDSNKLEVRISAISLTAVEIHTVATYLYRPI